MQSVNQVRWYFVSAIAAILISAWMVMSLSERNEPVLTEPARIGMIAGVVGLVVGWLLERGLFKTDKGRNGLIPGVLAATALSVTLNRTAGSTDLALCGLAGLAAAVIGYFAVQNESESETRYWLAAGIWVFAGAIGFSLGRAAGMSLCLLAGLFAALPLRNPWVLAASGATAALVAVRTFRLDYTAARLNLDFTHHHAILGMLFAAGAVTAWASFADDVEGGKADRIRQLLALVLALCFIAVIPILTGMRAVTGELIGIGFGITAAGYRRSKVASAWLIGGALFAVPLGAMNSLLNLLDLNQSAKMQWLGMFLVIVIVISSILYFLRPVNKDMEVPANAS